jgi:beta-lactam-binding protein with PASTA domain
MTRQLWATLATIMIPIAICGCAAEVRTSVPSTRPKPAASASTVVVPNLIGQRMASDTVADPLERIGLIPQATDLAGGSGDWSGDSIVLGTDPKPGAVVSRKSKVRVLAATREEIRFYAKHRTMPQLVGKDTNTADEILGPIIWAVSEKWRQRDRSLPLNSTRIVAQKPSPGKPLKMGQEIFLIVDHNISSGGPSSGHRGGGAGIGIGIDLPGACSRTRWC